MRQTRVEIEYSDLEWADLHPYEIAEDLSRYLPDLRVSVGLKSLGPAVSRGVVRVRHNPLNLSVTVRWEEQSGRV